jgi:hypothetical protein
MCGEWDSFTTYSTRLPGARTKSAEKTVTLEESAYLLDIKCHDIGYTEKCHDIGYRYSQDDGKSYERSP